MTSIIKLTFNGISCIQRHPFTKGHWTLSFRQKNGKIPHKQVRDNVEQNETKMNQTPSSYINKHTLMNITVGNKVMGQRGGQEGLSGLNASVGEPNTRPPLRRGWQGVWEAGDLGTETDGEWATDFSCTLKHTLSCLISFGERIVNTTRTCSKSWAKWGSREEGLRVMLCWRNWQCSMSLLCY